MIKLPALMFSHAKYRLDAAKGLRLILAALLTALMAAGPLAGCSGADNFTITGKIAGGDDDADMVIMWHDGHGMQRHDVTVDDGSFRFTGVAPDYSLMYILSGGGEPLACFIARNGDKIKADIDMSEPAASEARGNGPTDEINHWLRSNAAVIEAGDAAAINDAVEAFIDGHPASPAATALLTNFFVAADAEVRADSLLRLLQPQARSRALLGSFPVILASRLTLDASGSIKAGSLPGRDGDRVRLYPRESSLTLVAFGSPSGQRSNDSAVILLRDLTRRYPRSRLLPLEVSAYADSATWANNIASDSSAWLITWTPGVTADRQWRQLAVPSLPYFIVADSTGTQRLRTTSAARAGAFIEATLK